MEKIVGVTSDITNQLGQAIAITRISLVGVSKNVICGVTRHKNPNILNKYDTTINLEHELRTLFFDSHDQL